MGSIWLQSPSSPTTRGSYPHDVAFCAFVITMPGHCLLFRLSFERQASEPKNSMQSSIPLVLCLFLLYQERYTKFLCCDLERLAHRGDRDDTFSNRSREDVYEDSGWVTRTRDPKTKRLKLRSGSISHSHIRPEVNRTGCHGSSALCSHPQAQVPSIWWPSFFQTVPLILMADQNPQWIPACRRMEERMGCMHFPFKGWRELARIASAYISLAVSWLPAHT